MGSPWEEEGCVLFEPIKDNKDFFMYVMLSIYVSNVILKLNVLTLTLLQYTLYFLE